MQVVVAYVPPRGALETRLGKRTAVERHDVMKALVRHGHIAPQLRDGGIGPTTLVNEHVHALRNGMTEEALALAVHVRARDPGVNLARPHLGHGIANRVELGGGLRLVVAIELDVDAARKALLHRRKARKSGAILALGT